MVMATARQPRRASLSQPWSPDNVPARPARPETGFGRIFLTNTEMTRAKADDFKAIWDALKEAYAF